MAADQAIDGQFTIEPVRGILDPGKRVLCKVAFVAGVQPELFETTLYCEIAVLLEDPAHSYGEGYASTESGSEIIIDTWPKELGWRGWNKDFIHKSALALSTISSRSKVTDFAMKKSAANTYLHFFERLDNMETHTPTASNYVLYLTVTGHIKIKHYHPTTEDLLSAEDRLPWKPQERTELEVQTEFVNGILLEILQESLHDETHDASFSTLDTGRILEFEEFQQEYPRPLTEEEKFAKLFLSLGDGELPPKPPGSAQYTPGEPRPSLLVPEAGNAGEGTEVDPKKKPPKLVDPIVPRLTTLVRAVETHASNGPDDEPKAEREPPDYSSLAAMSETAELLLEDALFTLTSELFETD